MTLGVFFTALGYAVGAAVYWLEARRRKLATEGMSRVLIWGLIGGVLGAKLTEWILDGWNPAGANGIAILNPEAGGRTILGGVVAGWLCVEIAKRRLGIRRSTGDLFALALPAGEAVGRIGCFFNQCCYGIESNVRWAVYQHGAWRHPTQLYSSAVAFAILALLLKARGKLPKEGDLFRLYLVLWGTGRFLLEFLRFRHISFGGLSLAQWVCLEIVVLAGLALAVSVYRSRPRVGEVG